MSRVRIIESDPLYQVDLSREEVECLVALMYCNLRNPGESPISDLSRSLCQAMGIKERGPLSVKYDKFVRGSKIAKKNVEGVLKGSLKENTLPLKWFGSGERDNEF